MVSLATLSFLLSLILAFGLIRWVRGHTRHYADSKPQRFHLGDVPRLGGVAIALGVAGGWIFGSVSSIFLEDFIVHLRWSQIWPWLIMAAPATFGGALEDATQRLPARYRLGLTLVSAVLACWLLSVSIPRLELPGIDSMLAATPWLGVLLAVVAITGMPHAFNLIDGYNGLAGIVAVLVCLSIAHVALQVGDRELAAIVLCLASATVGFLVWNYPYGLIFAGDGGAYLWGVVTAVASILLVQRHAEVSAWFPLLIMIYPIWETVFSMYRKLARGMSPGTADALHFHQLIYRRIVRGVFHEDHTHQMRIRNNRTSPYLWVFSLLSIVPAVLFWRNTWALMGFCLLFVVSYVWAYVTIVRFKVPQWLR